MLKKISVGFLACVAIIGYAAEPSYTPEQQKNLVANLAQQSQQSQQARYDNSSEYEKKMFELTRNRVGGYRNVKVDKEIDLSGLTEAQKQSILITERNNRLTKESLRNDFRGAN